MVQRFGLESVGEDNIRTGVGIEFRFSWCLFSIQVNHSLLRYLSFTKIFVTECTGSAYGN